MSQTPRPMKRTDGMTGATPARRPRATPYPNPFLETPSKHAFQSAIAPRPEATPGRRVFSVLDESDEEEKEEEVGLDVEIKQEKEKNGFVGKKRKSLVGHSPESKRASGTSRGASKAAPDIRALSRKPANITRVTRSTTVQPSFPASQEETDSRPPSTPMKPPNAPRKVKKEFKIPAPPSKPRPARETPKPSPTKQTPRPKSQAKNVDTPEASSSRAPAVEMSEVTGTSFFHPDGTTRDIYVQGSEMVVKIRVEVPIYMDGSLSNVGADVIVHITSSLEHLMVPFLHHLTFRHTAPMTEKECFIRDVPIVYHMVHKPHGEGNTFERSRLGDECLMWEDMLVITPYLIIDEE